MLEEAPLPVNPTTNPALIMRQTPQNTDDPNPIEQPAMEMLKVFLNKYDTVDTPEMAIKRQEVLQKIKYFITEFVHIVAKNTGHDAEGLDSVQGQLVPYGSYRLGVVSAGSDIDCICVVPGFVKRSEFFRILYDILSKNSNVEKLVKIENAYSPIMTFVYEGIEVCTHFLKNTFRKKKENMVILFEFLLKISQSVTKFSEM